MPTWDEITPYTERDTRKWNAVNVLIGFNIAGLVLPAVMMFAKFDGLERVLTFHLDWGIKRGWIWQFFTYTFWHPPGIGGNSTGLFWALLAFAFGLWILHTLGRELEQEWGWRRFTTFYLATGVYGAVIHALYQAAAPSDVPAFDFLGPALSVMLVAGMKAPDRRALLFFFFPMRLLTMAVIMIGVVVLFTLAGFHTGITPVATLGSVAAAYAFVKLEPRLDGWLDAREQRAAREKFLDEFELKRQVDAILDKINREGMNSLSANERKVLKRASRLYADDRHE